MPFGVVSGVGRLMGVLDGAGNRGRGSGSFGGKYGTSHCNQWVLCGVVLCREGWRRDFSQITLGGLVVKGEGLLKVTGSHDHVHCMHKW